MQAKPWITPGILNSIKRRDGLLKKYINNTDVEQKNDLHTKYKALTNNIVAIIRKSRKNYYQFFFVESAKDIRKTWVGIKNITNIRSLSKGGQHTSMIIDKELVTSPIKIAEGFNSYYSSIAEKLQQTSGLSNNTFS